jgi:ABC-type dipeptide/oligopeptide/nickel transport system ATPase component
MNAVEAREFGISIDGRSVLSEIVLELESGKPHALVGEAASGKTVLLRALVGLWPANSVIHGSLSVNGIKLTDLNEAERREARSQGLIYLPASGRGSLNPVESIAQQIEDILSAKDGRDEALRERDQIRHAASGVLRQLGIADPARVLDSLPDELSGGMNKRVLLAMALLMRAQILAADEPTTGLDVTIQRQILDLVAELQKTEAFTLILATQNLGIVAHYAKSITVLDNGRIVEATDPERFFGRPESSAGQAMLERARAW